MSLLPLTLAMIGLLGATAAAAAPDLSSYRWKARPLVIFAPDTQDPRYRQQRAAAEAASSGLKERDMVVVDAIGPNAPLRGKLKPKADFEVMLIGKDGHVAERWSAPVALPEVFALIDRMPMRRDEMRRDGSR